MLWSILLIALPAVHAALIPPFHDHNDESHAVSERLPTTWYQPDHHPVHALFERAPPGDGTNYPPVGSPTWSSAYPHTSPDVSQLPKEWVDALNAAVAAGKIPKIPQSTNTPGVNPVYPPGFNPNGPEVCSSTYKCKTAGDIWDAPNGAFAISFDDGPTPVSSTLLQFLQDHNEIATHFVIGVNILQNPQIFSDIFNAGHDIAVHTWTHPYMTTLSNLEIVGQLGWTAELIRNSTGGRVPKYWRPPYGDSDMRVRAIASEVFGLQTVIWNSETLDWDLASGGTTQSKIRDLFIKWLTAPVKAPGLVTLEHEVSSESVQAFINNYPMIKPNGWQTGSLARLVGPSVYKNSKDSSSPVTLASIIAGAEPPPQQNSNTSASGSQTSTSQSTQTQTTTVPSSMSTSDGAASSPTANGALVSRDVPWNLAYIVMSCWAPAIMAMLSILM